MKKLIVLCSLIVVSIIFSIFLLNLPLISKNVLESVLGTQKTIIIDAGHGGFDGGTSTNDGVAEKGINLNIALYLRDYLEFFGFEVVMTRETDTSTEDEGLKTIRSKKSSDLHNRMELMEKTENAIFVSIHQNHFSVEKYNGAQVFYSKNFSDESSTLAESIQSSIIENLQPENNRQIKPCGTSVYLIYNAVKPAVLVECGFLSNNEEASLLKSQEYQQKMAFSIAMGIINYYKGL